MKTIYRNTIHIALSVLCCVFLAMPASAQRTGSGSSGSSSSSGGGGSRSSSGGGGGGGSRPSGGGGTSARPAGGANFSHPSGGAGVGNQHGVPAGRGPVYVDRQGNIIHNNVGVQRT